MKTGASWPMNSRGGQKNFFPDKSNRSISCKCKRGGMGKKKLVTFALTGKIFKMHFLSCLWFSRTLQ